MGFKKLNFSTRKMVIRDYDDALHLWRSLPGMGISGADEKSEIEKFLYSNPETCWIADKDGQLVGTVLGGSDSRRGYIYHLAVQKNLQGQGIGGHLLNICLREFTKVGIQKCHLLVYNENLSGIAFWKHAGWVLRDDVLVMSKEMEINQQ